MDITTAKNILKMTYDGKLRKITDSCILLPDDSLFNAETHEIKKLDNDVFRITGFANMKFIHAVHYYGSKLYDEYGNFLMDIQEWKKPKIFKISNSEYIIICKGKFAVYNCNIRALTKHTKYINLYIDYYAGQILLTYAENNNMARVKLNIL